MDIFTNGMCVRILVVIIMASTITETSGLSFVNPPPCNIFNFYLVQFGTDVIINCTTNPPSNSTLFFNSQARPDLEVASNSNVYKVYMTMQSDGHYKCLAQNQDKQIIWKCNLKAFHIKKPPKPTIKSSYEFYTGYSSNVTCYINKGLPLSNIKLFFMKNVGGNFVNVPENRQIKNATSVTLVFKNPSLMPTTEYQCVASLGANLRTPAQTVITIKDPIPVKINQFPNSSKFLILKSSIDKTISCSASGIPNPIIKWLKNGKELNENTFDCGQGSKCLTFPSTSYPRDEGNYTCLAINEIKSSSTRTIVAVFQFAPKLVHKKNPTLAQGNKPKNLTCEVVKQQGQVLPTFKWMRNLCMSLNSGCKGISEWQPIPTDHIQIPSSNVPTLMSTITVPFSVVMSSYYKCVASNSLGNDSYDIEFHRSKVSRPRVEIKGVDSFNEEETLKITCVVSVGNFTRWLKDGRKIRPSHDRRVSIARSQEGETKAIVTLTIINATISDTGRYQCKGRAIDGSKMNSTKMIQVRAVFEPNITSLSNITAFHFSNNETSIEVVCHVTANPKPQVTWSKLGSSLHPMKIRKTCQNTVSGYYLKSTPSGIGNVLLICDADNQHTGLYTCHAQNSKGKDVRSAYVDVLTIPKISTTSPYKIVYKSLGESFNLECKATGNPKPIVVWTMTAKNGSTISWPGKGISSLKIAEVTEGDYGNYTCTATNSRGSDRIVVDLRGSAVVPFRRTDNNDQIIMIATAAGGGLGIVFLIAIIACCFLNRRQKRLLEEYKTIKYLRKGEDYKLDPKRTILEQCEDLPYDADWEFPLKRVVLQGVIGSGTFGQVMKAEAIGILSFTARDKTSNAFKRRSRLRRRLSSSRIYQDSSGNDYTRTTVAVKTLKAEATENDYKDLATELKVMIHLGEHTNIINLLGACTRSKQLMIIMEYAPHGNLLNFLRSRREIYEVTWRKTANNPDAEFTLADLVMYSYQIARGMDFLSSKKCVHRDLAARNILVGDDYVMKIADFGLTRDIYKTDLYIKETTGLLPVKWMAPESLFDRVYTHKTDVWSFGVLLWEAQTLGGTPYPGIPVEELMDYLSEGKRMRQPKECPPEMYAIMRDCWLDKPDERPSFAELVRRIERIIEKKITGQEADDAYISVFMDEDLHRIYYLEPKDATLKGKSANLSDDDPQAMTEDEIQSSPLPPIPCLSLENIYNSTQAEDDPQYCDPIDNHPSIRYSGTPSSPKRHTETEPIRFDFGQTDDQCPMSQRDKTLDCEKRTSEYSTGVESGIDMDELYDHSLGRRNHRLKDHFNAEGTPLLDSSKVKDRTRETIL